MDLPHDSTDRETKPWPQTLRASKEHVIRCPLPAACCHGKSPVTQTPTRRPAPSSPHETMVLSVERTIAR